MSTDKIQLIRINVWDVQVSETAQVFPEWAVVKAQTLLDQWVNVFPREESWVQRVYGIPSLFVRFDCFIDEVHQRLLVCEIEDRPGGFGLTSQCNPAFKERLSVLRNEWPPFQVVLSDQPHTMQDDYLWLDREALSPASLILVRAEPDETAFHQFETRSVSTVIYEGDKSYGVPLGLWHPVTLADLDGLFTAYPNGFVLKPQRGSKCKNIEIFLRERGGGTSTRTRLAHRLTELGTMFCQEYFAPMASPIPDQHMIYRFAFGYSPGQRCFVPLGGLWMSRPEVKIHGAANSICGPLVHGP